MTKSESSVVTIGTTCLGTDAPRVIVDSNSNRQYISITTSGYIYISNFSRPYMELLPKDDQFIYCLKALAWRQ